MALLGRFNRNLGLVRGVLRRGRWGNRTNRKEGGVKIEIKNRFTGEIVLAGEYSSIKEALEKNSGANLSRAKLSDAKLSDAKLFGANLSGANLSGANLSRADLSGANLSDANLSDANLFRSNPSDANLSGANLSGANLSDANLSGAYLSGANLSGADLSGANLSVAYLSGANLSGTKGLIKIIGVEVGNIYWKAIGRNMTNEGYKFKIGINKLRKDEVFASDERVLCSHPGFHFASKSWCKLNYGERPYLCKIRIPEGAEINEPWATNGKASASMIEILDVYDMQTEKKITAQFKKGAVE
jgi:uncharacterized protein YjbI with pentapeptide repeats